MADITLYSGGLLKSRTWFEVLLFSVIFHATSLVIFSETAWQVRCIQLFGLRSYEREKLARQCRKLLWVRMVLRLLDWTSWCFSVVEGNSTNTCIHAFSLLPNHLETRSLLLPIPIGIVAYAFTLLYSILWDLFRNGCIWSIASFSILRDGQDLCQTVSFYSSWRKLEVGSTFCSRWSDLFGKLSVLCVLCYTAQCFINLSRRFPDL